MGYSSKRFQDTPILKRHDVRSGLILLTASSSFLQFPAFLPVLALAKVDDFCIVLELGSGAAKLHPLDLKISAGNQGTIKFNMYMSPLFIYPWLTCNEELKVMSDSVSVEMALRKCFEAIHVI